MRTHGEPVLHRVHGRRLLSPQAGSNRVLAKVEAGRLGEVLLHLVLVAAAEAVVLAVVLVLAGGVRRAMIHGVLRSRISGRRDLYLTYVALLFSLCNGRAV